MLSSVDKFDLAKKRKFSLHPAFQLTQSQTWFTDQHIVFGATIRTQVSSPEDIATAFSNHWLSKSDDHNLLQSFLDAKHNAYRQSNDEHRNKQLTSWNKTLTTLNSLKGNTPRSGKINYTMIQQTTKPVIIRI